MQSTVLIRERSMDEYMIIISEIPECNSQCIETNPWLATAGMSKDDPDLDDILEEIMAERDAEREEAMLAA